ncbi:MAG TPA: hypothetical protein VFD38_06550 [Myxococcaceae bacterium]|nr:hypothetical protein [Myxococcaceae bacterium]
MPSSEDEDLDSTPFEGDRPGPHLVDVLDELPVDGEQLRETQLMSDAELDPRAVQGDRFDVGDDDLGMAPDLEEDPDAPDLQPDSVERFAEADAEGEPDPDEFEDQVTARPTARIPDDARIEPAESDETP